MDTTNENMPLQFLRQKIQDVRSALFFSQNNDIIKMPTSIITVLRVDNEGFIWFFVKRPLQSIAAFEEEFPARLDFFRKKINYFLQVTGRAFVVNEKDISMEEWADVTGKAKDHVLNELILMKVKMINADFFDNSIPENRYWWENVIQKIKQWIFTNKLGYQPFDLRPKSLEGNDYGWQNV